MASKKHNPIHGLRKTSLLDRKWFPELISIVPGLLGAGVAAYKAFKEPNLKEIGWILAATCVWFGVSSAIKVWHQMRQDVKDDESRSHDGLIAALHVLHEIVARAGGLVGDERKCLRATVHRVLPPLDNTEYIEQIVPYVGGVGGRAGRKFPIRSGITGKAITLRKPVLMDRQSESYEDYKRELVEHNNYRDNDVETITSDRFSAIAIPIQSRDGQDIIGVIYLDSSKKKFFDHKGVMDAIIGGCQGVTQYTGERYV